MFKVVGGLGLGFVVGAFFERGALGFAVASTVIIAWWMRNLWRTQQWIEDYRSEPPETSGLWGRLYDAIYKLQRQSREAQFRLTNALDYLQDSLSSMRDAAVIVDARSHIAWANEAAKQHLGVRIPEDIGQSILNLIRSPEFHEYYEREEFGLPLRIEPGMDADKCWSIEISVFGDGDRLLFLRDITHWYRLEQMRRDFVGNVSHELRTPLTVIKGYLDTLIDLKEDDPLLQKPLKQMDEQVNRMENLLADLLWLSKIESLESDRRVERINMPTFLEEIIEEIASGYPNRAISLDIQCATYIDGNYQELHSAITNLLINALKYSDPPAPVRILWREAHDGGGELVIIDKGVGIEASDIPRLTERFYRVDRSRSQRSGGTGLGLAIVKHVVNAHGAELTIHSEVGVGSEFSLHFPVPQG